MRRKAEVVSVALRSPTSNLERREELIKISAINLFCLPYAGGSAAIYRGWQKYLHSDIRLEPVELAGRGKRFNERFYDNLEDAVEDVYRILKPKLDGTAYAIFGHSMGCMIAYELGHRLLELGCQAPRHLFFSGRGAPNVSREKKLIHRLPDAEFVAELRKLQGTPEEVLNHAELLQVILPVVRADFKIVELYEYMERSQKLAGAISILNGKADDITLEELAAWRGHTRQTCKYVHFGGGHFFIHDHVEEIVRYINGVLAEGK